MCSASARVSLPAPRSTARAARPATPLAAITALRREIAAPWGPGGDPEGSVSAERDDIAGFAGCARPPAPAPPRGAIEARLLAPSVLAPGITG